jgi:hypothetical protein
MHGMVANADAQNLDRCDGPSGVASQGSTDIEVDRTDESTEEIQMASSQQGDCRVITRRASAMRLRLGVRQSFFST